MAVPAPALHPVLHGGAHGIDFGLRNGIVTIGIQTVEHAVRHRADDQFRHRQHPVAIHVQLCDHARGAVIGPLGHPGHLHGRNLVNAQLAVGIGIRRRYTGGAGCRDLGLGHLAVLVGVQGCKVDQRPGSGAAGHHALSVHALSAHAHAHPVLRLRLRWQGREQPDAESRSQCRARQGLGPVHHTILFASGPVPRSMTGKRATRPFPSQASAEFCDITPQADPAPLHLPDKSLEVARNDRRTPNEQPEHAAGR